MFLYASVVHIVLQHITERHNAAICIHPIERHMFIPKFS